MLGDNVSKIYDVQHMIKYMVFHRNPYSALFCFLSTCWYRVRSFTNDALLYIFNCISSIITWMNKNFLKHNKDKTETIFIGKTIKTKWGNLATRIKPIVRKLGVFVDSGFTLNHTLLLVQHSFICWTPVKPLRCWHVLLFASFITRKRELITSIQGTLD